jgi:hypothetical protein
MFPQKETWQYSGGFTSADETELRQAEAAFLFQAKWFSTKPRIEALNGTQLEGRTLIINEAHP